MRHTLKDAGWRRWLRMGSAFAAMALLVAACAPDEDEPAAVEEPEDVVEEPEPDEDEAGDAVACEEEHTLVWAFITPEGSPYDAGGVAFGEHLEEHAPGCFDFQSFPAGQLGDERDIEVAMQSGAIQMGVGAFALEEFVPEAPLTMTPFVFEDRDHTYRVIDGPAADDVADLIEDRAGFKTLGYFTAGDRHILSTEPVRSEEDLEGLSLRVAPSDLQISIWSEIGVVPVDLPFGDMYTGLQTGTVDAIELDPGLIVGLSLYEVTDYYILTDHLTGAYPLIMDMAFYDALDPELQDVIDAAGEAAEEANHARDEELIEGALEALETEHGIEVIEFDNSELRERVRSVYEDFPTALPPDVLELILAEGS